LYVGFSINRRRKTEDGRRKTEDGRRKEDVRARRRQKTEDGRQAAIPSISFKDGRTWGLDLI
jgi:hypothetical protein